MILYLRDVATLEVDPLKCIGCGMCVEVCPRAVLALDSRKARIVNRDACIECGACENNCPVEALAVRTGTGCARSVINRMFGRKSDCCGGNKPCC